jgi:cytochrome c-type biogenesis protein CcmH/NrfG
MFALNSHRPNEAEQIADKILKGDPRHPQALTILGSALLMQDRVNDAIALLERAARGGQHPEIDTQLAIALRRAGRHDDALARLKRATRRQPPYPRRLANSARCWLRWNVTTRQSRPYGAVSKPRH